MEQASGCWSSMKSWTRKPRRTGTRMTRGQAARWLSANATGFLHRSHYVATKLSSAAQASHWAAATVVVLLLLPTLLPA